MHSFLSVHSFLTLAIFGVTLMGHVSANWGPWGEYGSCSMTCGGGVRSRTRRCTSLRVKSCTGESVSYESCQTQVCTNVTVDLRSQQCLAFNRGNNLWISHYDMSSPCTLFCENQLGQVVKLQNTVLDGTPCDSHHSFGLCIAGVCKQVGCDHVIGSTKTVDDCLVCGGRGENCDTLSGSSADTTLKVGETTNMATFPFGTTKLEIRATTREPVNIELRSVDGNVFNLTKYFTEGSHNRTVDFSGALVVVKPIDKGFLLTARGPLSRTLHLKVQPSGTSLSIKYEYSIPVSRFVEKDPQLRFSWVDGIWTQCSAICGPGQKRRAVICIDRTTGKTVDKELCSSKDMPALSRACQTRPCHQTLEEKYKWIPGTFSDCSSECGAGYQTQLMFCLQTEQNTKSAYVADTVCELHIGRKPVIRRACFGTETQCGQWITGDWSQCSVTCGQGRQTRSVACEKNYQEVDDDDDYGGDEIFPGNDQSLCSIDSRPASEQPCNPGTCNDSSDDEISIVTLIHDCQTSRYGCCSDNVTSAVGENQLGCNAPVNSDCRENTYGCCYDGVSSAKGPNKEGCPRLIGGCRGTRYGCCKDGVTAARGVNKEGCVEDNRTLKSRNACIDSAYGCCKDGTTAATGPNALGCPESKNVLIGGCRSTKYGCCSDGVTAAREDGCHVFDQAHCDLERDPGSCSNYTIKYHFDMNFGVCRQFWYGGCEGNQNRFLTVEDCNNNCVRVDGPGVCRLPKVTGVCKSRTNRFFYNHKTQQCEMFTYGGCKGNNNNFATIEDCQAKCGSSQQIKPTEPTVRQFACASFPCQNGFTCQDYQNGSYSCSCNPDWGKNCEAPPDYWCFSDSECSQSLKCIRQRKCQHGYCWIYARCSSVSKVFKCDKIDCPSRQVCVNDDSFQDGHFCIDATSYKRPTKVVLGCSLSEFGCCSDKQTPATGPNYQGCHKNCQTSKFGCCKDGVTSAEGYNYIGCEIDGSGELPCDKTVYGCCEDGITPAEGPRGQGCGDTVDSEDRVKETFTKKPTMTEKCIAMNGNVRCKQFVIKWRYSTEKKECERHWWGGCEDNGNIFDSKEHCEAICKSKTIKTETTFEPDIVSMCELPSERGPCRGNIQRYYYNPKEQSCILFAYGGCQGNENNFLTLEACQKECSGISVTARPDVINTQLPGPKIIVPEKNKVTLSVSGESKVKEGGEIKISCSASGTKQVNLKWYYNSIPASQVYGAQHRGKSTVSTIGYQKTVEIIIPQAQRNNSGTYTCRSSNGEIERIVITVHSSEVTSAPQSSDNIEVFLHGDSTTDVGSTISLTCRARGPSRPSGVEWYFNGRDINPEAGVLSINTYPDTVTRNAIISELAISKAQFSNEGTYFCKSKPYNFINKIKVSVRQGPALSGQVLIEVDSYSTDKEVVCKLPAVTGNCKSAYTRWYYDHSDGQCKQFIYGGCGGNNNNFVTLNLCNNFCSSEEICLKPKLVGRCRAAIPRFYFDNETLRCREFIYGGCDGNLNNFDSHSACDRRCASYRRQIVGTDVKIIGTKNPTYQDICKLPQNKGQCSGLHIRWYFDDSQNRCIRFQYTGCGGNDNRFVSELECLDRCKHTVRLVPTTPPLPTIAHAADKSACAQPKNPGNCEQWVVTWYYDMSRRICHRFYYGGCGGNANRFPDRESCENLCSSERTTRHERITERPSQCVYTTFGCCSDGISTALDRLKSNCYESNVVQPSRDHTLVVVQPLGDAVLTCHLRGSEVVWYRDSFLLSSNRKTEIHTNGSLILRRVTDDMAGTYSCRVLDRNNFPRLERFQVQISVPLDILPGPALMSFKPGSRAYLNCHTVGYPPPKITWEKNGVSLSNNHHFAVYRNGTLIIESVRAEDAGNYHCLADNGVSTKKTRTILLNIKETINVQIANHKGYYVEGETIQLSCTGNGFPSPSLEWVKDNRTLTTENNVQVDAGELTIKSASVEDSGTYRCVAKNNNNKAEAITTVQIKLQGPMIQCQDKLSRTRCMSIVRAHLCEIRYFYSSCCHSCEKVNRRPK